MLRSLFIGVDASFITTAASTRNKLTDLESTEVTSIGVVSNCAERYIDLPKSAKGKHIDHGRKRAFKSKSSQRSPKSSLTTH